MVQGMGDEVLVEQAGGARTRTRRCVAARAPRPADGMIRFVLGPDAALVPDLAARLPGRGMWVSADRKALTHALARNQFARAARTQVGAAPDLVDQVAAMLTRRCLDLVGLAAGGLADQLLKELGRLHGFREFAMPAGHQAVSNAEDEGTAQT